MNNEREKQLVELKDIIEDSIEYFCDQYMVSGEVAWEMVGALSDAKLKVEFKND
tara:strand:+ start:80 stop:241 length:162 start_codon:yes stop_codon:yes gene_type:complete